MKLKLSRNLFNDSFFPFLTDYKTRTEVYYGGAGSGKSVFVAQKLLIKAIRTTRRVLVIRKVAASLKDSCWQLILDLLVKWKLYFYCKINKSDLTITLPNGSVFIFKGLDDPEKIKSITGITDIWVEEASELTNEDEYDQLELRLRANVSDSQMFLSYNPISKANWVYRRFHESQPDEVLIHKSTYKDNRFLPKAYIRKLESLIKTNPVYYRVYVLGEFTSLDKLVFTNWEVRDFDDDLNIFEFDDAIFGLDFGYVNDPTAFVAVKVNKKRKELYIYDELYQTGMLNSSIANWIKYKGYSKEVIYADSAEQKSIEEIKRQGVSRIKPAAKGKGSVMWGIDIINQYRCYIASKCVNTITEFQNYSYKKDRKTNEYINEPVDEFNHLCDALRYAMQKITKPQLNSMSKRALGL